MEVFTNNLRENTLNYKQSLDRIIDKYSKLQGLEDGAIEVDLEDINPGRLGHYIKLSQKKLNKLKGPTDSRDETLMGQGIGDSLQLDSSYQGGGADETSISQNAGRSINDVSQLTVKSLNESQNNFSELELQPEDQDEELQVSHSSNSSSLLEQYPSMISRIKKAWERHNVSMAANSVLKRYRRWRQQSDRSTLSDTFNVSLRQNRRPEKMTSRALFNDNNSGKRNVTSPKTSPHRPMRTITNMHDWEAQQQLPGKKKNSLSREQQHPVFIKDFCGSFDSSEVTLNKTYITSDGSQPFYSNARASMASPFWGKRLSLPSLPLHGCSMNSSDSTTARERSDMYRSPVRHSPLKTNMAPNLIRSPHEIYRSPRKDSLHCYSREPMRSRSLSSSMCSPQRPVVLLRRGYPQNSPSAQYSSQSSSAAYSHHRLRRHLSFDSALPSTSLHFSPKKIDEDFMRVYHKFACQNKSGLFNAPPCRLCAQSSEESRGHSSSSLAALALSPHRSILRKRHREEGEDTHPISKRLREKYCMSSPGSKRHSQELLRRWFPHSELKMPHGKSNRFLQIRKRPQLIEPAAHFYNLG